MIDRTLPEGCGHGIARHPTFPYPYLFLPTAPLATPAVLRFFMLPCHGLGWGGVGLITFLALAHMLDATQHHVSCTCTHGRCYATSWGRVGEGRTCTHVGCYATSWGRVGVGWGGADNIPCTCTHVGCYATSCFLRLHTWSVLRNRAWRSQARLRKLKFSSVSHSKMQFTKKVGSQRLLTGTQKLDGFWKLLKKFVPAQITVQEI